MPSTNRSVGNILIAVLLTIGLLSVYVQTGHGARGMNRAEKPSALSRRATEAAVTSIDSRKGALTVVATAQSFAKEGPAMEDVLPVMEPFIVGIGDSLTQGVGDRSDGGGYVERVRYALSAFGAGQVHAVNLGKNGVRSDQLLGRLRKVELRSDMGRAQTVLLSIGGNDLMKVVKDNITNLTMAPFEQGLEEFGRRFGEILQHIRTQNPEARIYALGLFNPFSAWFADITEMKQILADWNGEIERICEQTEDVTFVPIDDIFDAGGPDLLGDDLFHPNEEGYRQIAERVLAAMMPQGDGVIFHEDNR